MKYEDGYHFQNVLAPLVKLEADYDKRTKEALAQDGITVRWEQSLNKKHLAVFRFSGNTSAEDLRVGAGEELLLKLDAPTVGHPRTS